VRSTSGPSAPPSGEAREFFNAIRCRLVWLGEPDKGGIFDLESTLIAMLDQAHANAILLRPDRVVAASAGRVDLAAWRRFLESAGTTANR
jgi:3-(3-hydroxy-phenyl)propionate hydroxylase